MKTRRIEGVEVLPISDNIFADLGLPDADKLKIKTGLVIEIRKAMRSLDLTQKEAAKRMSSTACAGRTHGRCAGTLKATSMLYDVSQYLSARERDPGRSQ